MQPFAYLQAQTTADAVAASTRSASYIAGGTGLLDLMKLEVQVPESLIDINRLALKQIESTSAGLRIGALVSNTDVAYHPTIREKYPLLSEAILSGASPQLRNMATVGGNLMQRTRCAYFRDTSYACNKRTPGSGCAALHGYNRSHAVLGTSDRCIAVHPSDMCVALAALDAIVHVEGPSGSQRQIPFSQFHVAYGDDPVRETTLQPGELITLVELPAVPFAANSMYLKVRDRESYEFALVSVAVALDVQKGIVRQARLALGGVATKPWRSLAGEKALVGQRAVSTAFQAAAQAAMHDAVPREHNAFKIDLARRAIVRALTMMAKGK